METLTIAEAAEMLGVSESTIRYEVRRGNLPVLRLTPRKLRIPAAAVRERLEPTRVGDCCATTGEGR